MVFRGREKQIDLGGIQVVSQLDPVTGENMRARVWIGGLPASVKDTDILPHFEHYGAIKWVKVYPLSRGAYAFMQFEYAEHASSVLKEMNQAQIFESGIITVKRAKMEVTKEQAAADAEAEAKAKSIDQQEMDKHREREAERLQVLANTKALEEERVRESQKIRKANEKRIRKEELGLDTSSEEEKELEEEAKQVEENKKEEDGTEVKKEGSRKRSRSKKRSRSRKRSRSKKRSRSRRRRSRSRRGGRRRSRSRRGGRKRSRSRRGARRAPSRRSRRRSPEKEYYVSVQNLPESMTEEELKEFCGKFIKSIRRVRIFKTLEEIQTGSLCITNKDDIEKLKKEMDGNKVKGCPDKLKVVEGDLYKE